MYPVNSSVCALLCLLVFMPVHVVSDTCEGPDDLNTPWPTEEELKQFGGTISGDIYLPGSQHFLEASSAIKNDVFKSEFGAVVYPENTDDVQKAVLFAKQHGIRPTVLSTGHESLGRSGGQRTFHISMKRMKQFNINTDDEDSPTGKSVRFGTGNTWADIYDEVDKHELIAVGTDTTSVSPGGYIMGGGVGPISRMFGFGVDQVLEFTIVTADGRTVTVVQPNTQPGSKEGTITKVGGATEEIDDNGDLWWSVLGGGGGVYGIITEYKYKLYDPPADGFFELIFIFPIHSHLKECVGVASEALGKFYTLLKKSLPNRWGGYVILLSVGDDDPFIGTYHGSVVFHLLHWGGDMEQAKVDMKDLTSLRPECQHESPKWTRYKTFQEYASTQEEQKYEKIYAVNRVLQTKDLEDDSGLVDFITSIEHVQVPGYLTCYNTLIGGKSGDMSQEATSVNPALRTSPALITCTLYYHEEPDASVAEAMGKFTKQLNQFGNGSYIYFSDYFLKNWKEEYWGSMNRYNRLLRVKQQWDPDNLFWCHHCVGSDLVTHKSNTSCPNPYAPKQVSSDAPRFPVPAFTALVLLMTSLFGR